MTVAPLQADEELARQLQRELGGFRQRPGRVSSYDPVVENARPQSILGRDRQQREVPPQPGTPPAVQHGGAGGEIRT
jgi:hypothetical protein